MVNNEYEEMIKILKDYNLPPNSNYWLNSMLLVVSKAYQNEGDRKSEAIECAKTALENVIGMLGNENQSVMPFYIALSEIYADMKDNTKAVEVLNGAL